jgi:hypothetical protein
MRKLPVKFFQAWQVHKDATAYVWRLGRRWSGRQVPESEINLQVAENDDLERRGQDEGSLQMITDEALVCDDRVRDALEERGHHCAASRSKAWLEGLHQQREVEKRLTIPGVLVQVGASKKKCRNKPHCPSVGLPNAARKHEPADEFVVVRQIGKVCFDAEPNHLLWLNSAKVGFTTKKVRGSYQFDESAGVQYTQTERFVEWDALLKTATAVVLGCRLSRRPSCGKSKRRAFQFLLGLELLSHSTTVHVCVKREQKWSSFYCPRY